MTCHLATRSEACRMAREVYRNPECKGCEIGQARAKGKEPKIPAAAHDGLTETPAEIIPKIIPAEQPSTERKEDSVATDLKERVLETITRRQPCPSGPILQNLRISADELRPVAEELEKEGKITVWTKGRGVRYTLKGQPSPFPVEASAEKVHGNSHTPTVPVSPPQTREKKKKSATPSVALATPAVAQPSNGSVSAMIDQIQRMRDTYNANADQAIAALRTLA